MTIRADLHATSADLYATNKPVLSKLNNTPLTLNWGTIASHRGILIV